MLESQVDNTAVPGAAGERRRYRALLILLLLTSCALRLGPSLWGSKLWSAEQYAFHTDEPKLVRFVDEFPESLETFHDYRYPTLVPIALGVAWSSVGGFGTREAGTSLPGQGEYESAQVFGRVTLALLAALVGGLCIWASARRMFGEEAALYALAATNLMGRPVVSAALVQTDIPASWLMVSALLVALCWKARGGLDKKGALFCGLLTGLAAGAKYTAVVAGLPAICVLIAAWHSGSLTLRATLQRAGVLSAGVLAALLLSVPGIVYDWANFRDSIAYEFTNKIVHADFAWSTVEQSVAENYPRWLVALALIGVLAAWRRASFRCIHVGIGLTFVVFVSVSLRAFKPDYALFLYPLVGIYAGAGIACVRRHGPGWVRHVLVLGLVLGHAHTASTVIRRYTGETHYEYEAWLSEHVDPQGLGLGPRSRPDPHGPRETAAYPWVDVHEKPEWVVIPERCSWFVEKFLEDPSWFKDRMGPNLKYSVEPGERRLAGVRERDFQWYEDVYFGMGREYDYELVYCIEPAIGPFDDGGLAIRVYRRR